MAANNHISFYTTDTTSSRRLTKLANVPSSLPVADGQRSTPQPAGRGRLRRKAAIQANVETARQMKFIQPIENSTSGAPRGYVASSPWEAPSTSAPISSGGQLLNKTRLAPSTTFQAGAYRLPYVQTSLHRLETESSDPQLPILCTGGDHAFKRLTVSQPPRENVVRQTSSLGHAQSAPGPSRHQPAHNQPPKCQKLREAVWFVMNAARLDAYHQKLVWLYAGNSLAARIRVLLWVRNFMRKIGSLPMLVNIRVGVGAKGGVDSVLCNCPGCSTQKSFKEVQSAAEHVVSKHVGGMTWKCKHPGCEKSYNHSFDLKRHEKKHGLVNPTKQRIVTKIQRATSIRSRGGRKNQVPTSSSFGRALLAPVQRPTDYLSIFPNPSEYPDLSQWSDRGLPSPSSSMGPPDSPFSTSFSHSTMSTPARSNYPLSSPNRSAGSHIDLPAHSHGPVPTSYSQTLSGSADPYSGGLRDMYADTAYNTSPLRRDIELSMSQDSTASGSGSGGGLLFPSLSGNLVDSILADATDTRYMTLPPATPSTPLHPTRTYDDLQPVGDPWDSQFPRFTSADLAMSDTLDMLFDTWTQTTSGVPSASIEEYSTVYGASDAITLGRLTGQSTSSRALTSGQLVTTVDANRGQPRAANTSIAEATYSRDAMQLHSQVLSPQGDECGWWMTEDGNSRPWPWN